MGSTESSKVDVNLDLGGNTLTFATGATANTSIFEDNRGCLIVGGQDSNVTISNGTIVNDGNDVYAVVGTNNGHLTLDNVNI